MGLANFLEIDETFDDATGGKYLVERMESTSAKSLLHYAQNLSTGRF